MKKIFGFSLVVIGGASIAYVLSLKNKKVAFADNLSTKCDNLSYEKEKTFGDLQEFNSKNPFNLTPEKIKSQPDSYWQNITRQRSDLTKKYNTANLNWKNSECETSQKSQDTNDCNRLKENIDDYKGKIAQLEKDPKKDIYISSTAGQLRNYKGLLATNQKAYDSKNCVLNTKSDVSVSNASLQECAYIDMGIKLTKDKIFALNQKALTKSGGLSTNEKISLKWSEINLNLRENEFTNKNCRDKIETSRLTNTAIISTKIAEKMEEQVLSKNEKEKYVYIGVGGLVLLTGLLIVLKK
jgi:hypothetical protein